MRDHSKHVEVSIDDAVSLLLSHADFSPAVETVALANAESRILAEDAVAQLDMPNTLTCRMDSVAVHWDDFADGMPDTTGWERGNQWQFANTGVGMPEGFDTAIAIEHVILSDDLATISFDAAPSKQYAGTKAAGSTMRKGDVLVNAGCVLTPLLLSAIASGGNTEAKVLARPKVAFIPTGNELVTPAAEIPRGKNIETNSLLICGKIRQWGGIPIAFDIVPDNQEAIKEAVLKACAEADIVVLNAGSSKGSDDWNVEMLDEVGTVLYHEVNHGPGHHSSGAVVNGTPVVGISGPPGGASFTTDFYLYPLMMKYLGQPTELKKVTARLAKDFPKAGPKPKTGEQPNKAKGEDRPPMVLKHEFFSIRQVVLSVGEDGCLEARPSAEMHLSLQASDAMDAYFPASSMKLTPHRGDLIEVWLRA